MLMWKRTGHGPLALLLAVLLVFSSGAGPAFAGGPGETPSGIPPDAIRLLDEVVDVDREDHRAGLDDPEGHLAGLAARAQRIGRATLDREWLLSGGWQAGDVLVMEGFGGCLHAVAVETVSRVDGPVSLLARSLDSTHGYLNLSVHDGTALAVLRLPGENRKYVLAHNPADDHYYIHEILLDQAEVYQQPLPALVPPPRSPAPVGDLLEPQGAPPGPEDPATVDVLVLYTPAAAAWGGGAENLINLAHADAIYTLDNSDTGIDLRKVHTQTVEYTETGDMVTDLYRLTRSDGEYAAHLGEVHDLRDEVGADLVVLFGDYEPPFGGLAWGLFEQDPDPDYGFAIVNIRAYAGYTYIHEIGHIFGAGHHRDQEDPGPQRFEYSAGWNWTGDDSVPYCSVMSYRVLDGVTHERVAHFSNPEVLHMGQPTGVTDHADNARTLRETKHMIAAFREKTLSVTTPDTPVGPGRGYQGLVYTFSTGGAACYEGHGVEYRFDWGDGSFSGWDPAPDASHTWGAPGSYPVRAQARCVADPGQVSVWSGSRIIEITEPLDTGEIRNLEIGARVVDPSWEWEFRTGYGYTAVAGDQTGPVVWIVVAKDHYGENSGVTLLSEELIGLHAFDDSTSRPIYYYDGSNHWGDSGSFNATAGLRTWLNSSGIQEGSGFAEAFSESFRRALIRAEIPHRAWEDGSHYTTRDLVFIPSTTELGDTAHTHTHAIGSVFPYFAGAQNADRIATLREDPHRYWTRSPSSSVHYYLHEVFSDGGFRT